MTSLNTIQGANMKYIMENGKKKAGFDLSEAAVKLGIKKTSLSVYLAKIDKKFGVKDGRNRYLSNDDLKTLRTDYRVGVRANA